MAELVGGNIKDVFSPLGHIVCVKCETLWVKASAKLCKEIPNEERKIPAPNSQVDVPLHALKLNYRNSWSPYSELNSILGIDVHV